jgi:phospholipase D3/4
VQHSGFAPDFDQESADLAAGRPNVQNVTLLFDKWWGSGIVHAKVWISDKKDVYIGSANNDWKSLTQVYQTKNKFSCISYFQFSLEKQSS